ncbi:MAG: hypothetical protein ABWY37_02060 [Microbacterium pygmaeum]
MIPMDAAARRRGPRLGAHRRIRSTTFVVAVLVAAAQWSGCTAADPVGFTAQDLEDAWAAAQPHLVALRPNTPHLIATGSDHYIHVRQPDLVAAMVDIVAGRSIR